MIKIIFLGTSDAIPDAERNTTSVLLIYKNENILIDCGEGTQRQFRKLKLNPCKITRILITHWHGDHVLGLPGLLQTLSFSGYNKTLLIYGPKGTKNFMNALLKTFVFQGKYNIKIEEVDGKFFENDDFYLETAKMSHGIPCNAYNFIKKGQLRIDKKKLEKAKLQGPIIKRLKEGKDVIYKGKKYLAKTLTFREGDKKISFVFDTSINNNIVPFAKNSDLLICESTFNSELEERAKEYKHLTTRQTAEIAKKSKSKKLVLTHLSQRYTKNIKKILEDVRKIFKNSFIVKDFDVIEV
ncbi:MAG: ribonuclease Z [Candidatus Pacearchaeota archaeon]|nr:ribonuclease Z [Candidatus Pacearchaeota archaeon]